MALAAVAPAGATGELEGCGTGDVATGVGCETEVAAGGAPGAGGGVAASAGGVVAGSVAVVVEAGVTDGVVAEGVGAATMTRCST